MIDSHLIAAVCNGDLLTNPAIVSARLSSNDGLNVRSSTAGATRINVSVARV